MLALILSIGIPLAYVLAGMFISRNYWFNNRNRPEYLTFRKCPYCSSSESHFFVCPWRTRKTLPFKTFFALILWPIAFISQVAKKFYQAPEKKLIKNQRSLEQEIDNLRDMANSFESNSASRKTITDIISVKTKELKGMK
jgi:hypothetical protein